MEINLTWYSTDDSICEYTENITTNIINSNYILTNPSQFHLTTSTLPEHPISPSSTPSSLSSSLSPLHITLHPSSSTLTEISSLLSTCKQKEKHLSILDQSLTTLKQTLSINPHHLKQKLLSLIRPSGEYYSKIQTKIKQKLLNYASTMKEIENIKAKFVKYKANQLISLYYKMAIERFKDCLSFVFQYAIIFDSNETVLQNLISSYQLCVCNIVSQANKEILSKIENEDVVKEHYNDYIDMFKFILTLFELFPLLKNVDMQCPQVVFSEMDEPVHVNLKCVDYFNLKFAKIQMPSSENLQFEFNNFQDEKQRQRLIEMAFKRDFSINKKFGVNPNHYIYSSLIYEF